MRRMLRFAVRRDSEVRGSLNRGSPADDTAGNRWTSGSFDDPGYVFHHSSVDSINLYNGSLTIPIAIGPSYPVGPKLKFQAMFL